MLPDSPLAWILAGAVCLLLGKEIGKLLPSLPSLKSIRTSAQDKRRAAAEKLATSLKVAGLQMVQDARDSLDRIAQVASIVKESNDAILKELAATYEKVAAQAPSQTSKVPLSAPSPASPASTPSAPSA